MLKLYRFLKPYTIQVIGVFVLVFLQSMSELYLPTLLSDIVNKGIVNRDVNHIWNTGGVMLLIAAGGAFCAIFAGLLSSQISMNFGRILRAKIFTHVTHFSLHEFDKFGAPSLVTRTTNDITQIQMVTMILMRMMIMAPIMCIGGIIMALSKDKGLAWVIVVVVPILAMVLLIFAKIAFPIFKTIQAKIDKINLVLREGLTGIRSSGLLTGSMMKSGALRKRT